MTNFNSDYSNDEFEDPEQVERETNRVAQALYETMQKVMNTPFFETISPRSMQIIFAKLQSNVSANLITELELPREMWDKWIDMEVKLYAALYREAFRMQVNSDLMEEKKE